MFPLTDGMRPAGSQSSPSRSSSPTWSASGCSTSYQHLDSSIYHASFYPCDVNSSCHRGEPWGVGWITAMFMHARLGLTWATCSFSPSSARTSRTHWGGWAAWLLSRGRLVADEMSDRDDAALRHRRRRADTQSGRERRDRRRTRRLLRDLPQRTHLTLMGWWPVKISAWIFLGFWFSPPVLRGELRAVQR